MFASFQALFNSPVFVVFGQVYHVLAMTAFLWGPALLVWLAAKLWYEYVQMKFRMKNFDFIMLEIKLPRIIDKTPVAMELVLLSLYHPKVGNWWDRWWDGYCKAWFSLEIVSIEGAVKFFIRTPKKYKNIIESHIYAQYPDIEVHESEDYVSLAPFIHEKNEWSLWGCSFSLTKPDPYPIKTYIDYGLDSSMIKEENKSDPITSVIEFLGSIGRGQQIWMQILVQSTNRRYATPGKFLGKHDWKDEGKALIKEIQSKYGGEFGVFKATKREGEIINAIERSLGKPAFDCGIRTIYIAKKENYDSGNIAGLVSAFSQYSSLDLNGFKPSTLGFDYPWQDWNDYRLNKQKHKFYDAFVRRSFFYPPYKKKPFVLNTEELATIFHFPGGVAETPTFTRIESRKGEPPANLPI